MRRAAVSDGHHNRAAEADRLRRHHDAVVQAEVRRLLRAIGPYRVLSRDTLSHITHAERWSEGGLDGALRAAVEEGVLAPLPFGYYRDRTDGAHRTSAGA
jgi:hypothetical protein